MCNLENAYCFNFLTEARNASATNFLSLTSLVNFIDWSLWRAIFSFSLMNEVVHTSPTIGSNVEEIVVKNTHFLMWDIGGQESLRSSWNTYYSNTEVWEASLKYTNSVHLFKIMLVFLLGILIVFYEVCSCIVFIFLRNNKSPSRSVVWSQFPGNILSIYFKVMFHLW